MRYGKKEIKKRVLLLMGIIFIFGILGFVIAEETWPAYNVCCEKTKNGAWCQNTLKENCDTQYRSTPTSCDATSFCKLGCCIDTSEGLCMENTPEKVCEETAGSWIGDAKCNVQQCELGCCILGDQASFVTLTRCKKLSSFYGLETNFKRNIHDETSCVLLAHLQDKGACVYEIENMKTCRFVTRAECLDTNKTRSKNMTSAPTFYKDYLCSADELGTNCGPSTKTTCIEGRDEVYFVDTCGNPANIYDASKVNNPAYWKRIVGKAESCGFKNGNAGSKTCGNCEYFKGSICGKGSASYGDNICKDLNCYNTDNGEDYKNGESWCVDQGKVGEGRDLVGSRHFRHICINGEEIVEPCADFRNDICIENILETSEGNFIEAACRTNRWKDCLDQTEKDDCLNTDKRDCYWSKGASVIKTSQANETGSIVGGIQEGGEICLPNFPPGFKFWSDGDAKALCSLGNSRVEITLEKDIFGKKKCSKNCFALEDKWAGTMNNVCTSLGDCGSYFNIAGKFTNKGAEWKVNGEKKVINGILERARAKSGS